MRTRTLVPTVAVATALVCAAVFSLVASGAEIIADEPAVNPERCAIPHGSGHRFTVLSNTYGRIWAQQYTTRAGTQFTKYYACSNVQRRHRYLATAHVPETVDEGDETQPFARVHFNENALDAVAVAFVKEGCPAGTDDSKCEQRLRWVRFKDGKVLREVVVPGTQSYIGWEPVSVYDTYLAYVIAGSQPTPDCGPGCGVHVATRTTDEVVDSGPAIDPSSLTRGSSAIFWINGNDARAFREGSGPLG